MLEWAFQTLDRAFQALRENQKLGRVFKKLDRVSQSACPMLSQSAKVKISFWIRSRCWIWYWRSLCYWFQKSSKRKLILKEYNEFCEQECVSIVKHTSTRYFTVEKSVAHELEKFQGINLYIYNFKQCITQTYYKTYWKMWKWGQVRPSLTRRKSTKSKCT